MSGWLKNIIARYGGTRLLESYVFPSRQVRLRLPLFIGCPIPAYFLERANALTCGEVNISVFSNVLCHHGDVFGLDQLPEVPGQLGFIPQIATAVNGELNLEPHVIFDETHILCTVHHSAHNFYHFMIDYLCYLQFRSAGPEPWKPFLLIKESQGFHRQAMSLLFMPDIAFHYLPTSYLHRRLALPSLINKPDVVDFLRLNSRHIQADGVGRRIYISRRSAKTRTVINEQEVIDYLSKHGFEVVESEKMSLVDQIALFKAADIICAPHGAGLTNIAFCKEGTSIIEFFLEERLPLSGLFWEIGCAGHLLYTFVKATRVPDPDNLHPMEGNLYVSPTDLKSALKQTLSGRMSGL